MNFRFLILVVLTCCFACNSDTQNDKDTKDGNGVCDISTHDGYHTLTSGEETREYILHIPSSYDGNLATPVIINYHGYAGCALDFSNLVGNDLGLNALADAENFIVVYPQAIVREKGDAYWEPGDNGNQNIRDNDSHFTRELISALSTTYNIDVSRVYATGYSNGGMMAYGLACATDDMIAAVGVMSGIMLEDACQNNGYTSVIHFHGLDDNVLPYAGNVDYQSVQEVIDLWVSLNSIPDSGISSTELDNGDVILDTYLGGIENSDVILYTLKKGDHVWFNNDINGQSANQILWDFLSKHVL